MEYKGKMLTISVEKRFRGLVAVTIGGLLVLGSIYYLGFVYGKDRAEQVMGGIYGAESLASKKQVVEKDDLMLSKGWYLVLSSNPLLRDALTISEELQAHEFNVKVERVEEEGGVVYATILGPFGDRGLARDAARQISTLELSVDLQNTVSVIKK